MSLDTKENGNIVLEENNTILEQEKLNEEENNITIEQEKLNKEEINKTKKKKGIVKKIFGILSKTLILSIIVIITIIAVRAIVFKKYDFCGYRMFLIMSGSMEPTIHISDAVIAKEQKIYNEGDIIAFDYDGVTTVHRIIKIYHEDDKCLYQTKGDNNNAIDKGIHKEEQVIGRIVLRIPKVGNAMIFVQKNFIAICIALIAILLVVILVRRLL